MHPAVVATPLLAFAAGCTYATVAPGSCLWGRVVSRGPRAGGAVALTFDDGPTPGGTDRVLDVLARHGVRGTFFVIGRNVERAPELVRRMDAEGHLVANHTYSHSHYGSLGTRRYWLEEIRRTDDLIARAIGRRPAMFRPPMGVKTWHTLGAARELGHTTVAWSRRSMDGVSTSPGRILGRLGGLAGGDIVLLHDGVQPHRPGRDPAPTIQALPQIIEGLEERGLTAVGVDELLGIEGYGA